MKQIPNIEETNDFPELEKQYVAMWDKGEFEWNHHEGDELGKKPISPWRIWTTFIKPTLHHQLQKARQEERERIKKEIMQQTMLNDGSDTFVKLGEALFVCDSIEDRRAFLKALHKDHSELDQDTKETLQEAISDPEIVKRAAVLGAEDQNKMLDQDNK